MSLIVSNFTGHYQNHLAYYLENVIVKQDMYGIFVLIF